MVLLLKSDFFNSIAISPLFLFQKKNMERRTTVPIYNPPFGIKHYILNFRKHF